MRHVAFTGRSTARFLIAATALVAMIATAGCLTPAEVDQLVHINEIQVIGSHNSYHQIASVPERTLRGSVIGAAAEREFEYAHRPLDVQFQSEKVRQIELDIFNDQPGGTYAKPLIRQVTGGGPYNPLMLQPGIKVLHAQDVDYRSNCLTLQLCLTTVRQWSLAHPSHVPITILLELKDDIIDVGPYQFVHPEPFDVAAMDRIDAEIRTVFPPSELITPDDVRGAHSTLEEAVTSDGWPTLADSRGKVMFLMDNGGHYRTDYLTGHPSLAGRVLFTNSNPGNADAAFVERNDAKGSLADIQQLVADGYVVRTRSDSPGNEVATNDRTTLEAALASGAQWVSTDYPVAGYSTSFGTDYVAQLPSGTVARCNPVNAPDGCWDNPLDRVFTAIGPPDPIPPLP